MQPSKQILEKVASSEPSSLMEKGEEQSVESPMDQVKKEVLDLDGVRDEAAGEEATLVAMEGAAAGVEITVRIAMAKLHCPVCTLPFKPPIFKCAEGHLACGACHDRFPSKDRCYKCAHAGGYCRDAAMEDVVLSTKIMCPYAAYGCRSYVTYHRAGEHRRACPHAPCRCSEPGCAFVGAPPALRDHLRDAHAWPVDKVRYGKPHQLRMPESQSQPQRRLLVAEDDGGGVFVVSVSAPAPAAARRGVSLECVRASGAGAAAGPQYTCRMWATGSAAAATGKVPSVFAELEVPSSAAPGEAAAAAGGEEAPLVVQRKMLHGPSKELHLSVRIDKVQA